MRTYNAVEKRAVNQIWTASGKYHFEPLFLSYKKLNAFVKMKKAEK